MHIYLNKKDIIDLFNRIRKKYSISHYRIAKLAELDIHTVRDIINYNINPLSITFTKLWFGLLKSIEDNLIIDTNFAKYILNAVAMYYNFSYIKLSKITYLDKFLIAAILDGAKVGNDITMQIFLCCLNYIEDNNDLSSDLFNDITLMLLYFVANNAMTKTILQSGLLPKIVLDIFKEQYNITPHKIATNISVNHKNLDRIRKELSFPTLQTQTKLYSYVYYKLKGFGDIKHRCEVAETFLARIVSHYYFTNKSMTMENITVEDKLNCIDILLKNYGFDKIIAYNSLNLELGEHYSNLLKST